MDFLSWVFLGVIIGAIVYLVQIILAFMEKYRASRDRIEQALIDIDRLEDQFQESEHARTEAEKRASEFEEETLLLEQEISEIQTKIASMMPSQQKSEPRDPSSRQS